ncbi:mechanosensitive ion channel family protein [Balneolales bacterium ANBcel1]|nr:mechanosensitive ion channel family protein [Balneolales bacterium ANBcel1]
MDFISGLFEGYLTEARLLQLIRVLFLIVIGFFALIFIRRSLIRYVSKQYNAHYGMLVGKLVFYSGAVLLVIMVLHDLGFGLTPLLGAAGVVGLALGFASQTSISNVISGFFLIAEQSFKVGDVVSVSGNVGIVLSIDTLSVKLRMFDNRFLRVPNESMIKSEFINITRFPIRRVDCNISVAYKEDLKRVSEVLFDVAEKIPYSLQEPPPLLIFDKFGNSSIDILFVAWAAREDFLKLRNGLNMGIKERFDKEGIEIPFPHVSVYAGSASEPLPVDLIGSGNLKTRSTSSEK